MPKGAKCLRARNHKGRGITDSAQITNGARREIPNDATPNGASLNDASLNDVSLNDAGGTASCRLTISQIGGIVAGPFGVVDHVAWR